MSAGLGALSGFTDPNTPGPGQEGPTYGTPLQSAMPAGANVGYAVGDLYGDYKRAQMAQVTNATALNKAARERVSQIWEMGSQNPQLQQHPQVKAQIEQLYKTMGMPAPVVNGNIDWAALRPAQQLSDLSPSAMTMLSQATPESRRALGHSLGLVGVGDEFYNAPPQLNPAQRTAVLNDYSRMVMGGGAKGMTAASFQNWVETNRNNLEQAVGPGAADSILGDPNLFNEMQQQAVASLSKIQAQVAQLKGIPAVQKSTITRNLALATNSTNMADLAQVRGNYINAQITALPQELQDKHALAAARIAQLQQAGTLLQARVTQIHQGGATDTALGRDLRAQVASDTAVYDTAQRNFASALANGDGVSVPEPISTAMTDAKSRLDQDTSALKDYASPSTQNTVNANRAKSVTGADTQPVGGTSSNWKPVMTQTNAAGVKIGPNQAGTGWVTANGQPYNP